MALSEYDKWGTWYAQLIRRHTDKAEYHQEIADENRKQAEWYRKKLEGIKLDEPEQQG